MDISCKTVSKLEDQKIKTTVKVELYVMTYLISLAWKSSKKKAYCAGPAHLPNRSTASAPGLSAIWNVEPQRRTTTFWVRAEAKAETETWG